MSGHFCPNATAKFEVHVGFVGAEGQWLPQGHAVRVGSGRPVTAPFYDTLRLASDLPLLRPVQCELVADLSISLQVVPPHSNCCPCRPLPCCV